MDEDRLLEYKTPAMKYAGACLAIELGLCSGVDFHIPF